MTARAIFALFVRMTAFLLALYGVYNLLFGLLEAVGMVPHSSYGPSKYAVIGLAITALGTATLMLAGPITRLANRWDRSDREE